MITEAELELIYWSVDEIERLAKDRPGNWELQHDMLVGTLSHLTFAEGPERRGHLGNLRLAKDIVERK